MIKVSIPAILIAVLLLTGVATFVLTSNEFSRSIDENVRTSLRRSANVAEQAARLEESSLLAKATYVGQGDSLYRAMKGEIELEERPDDISYEEEQHLVVHDKLTAQKYKLDDIAKAVRGRRNLELGPLQRTPQDYDIFIALNAEGVGVAALGKNLFSWFGADVSAQHATVKEVMRSGETRIEHWDWSFSGDDKRIHRVAIAPIRRSETEAPIGVVVVGYMLGDGTAKAQQKLLAGVSEDSTDTEALAEAPGIVMFRGTEVVSSTFDSATQASLSAALEKAGGFSADAAAILELTVDDTRFLAMVRPLAGTGDKAMGVVILANLTQSEKPVGSLQATLAVVFLLMLLLGVSAVILVLVRWLSPLEQLETGMQEVIAGNRDYTWEPLKNHDFQESLAQSLNAMSASLQGKKEGDGSGEAWSDDMQDSAPKQTPKIQGVAMPMMQTPPPEKND